MIAVGVMATLRVLLMVCSPVSAQTAMAQTVPSTQVPSTGLPPEPMPVSPPQPSGTDGPRGASGASAALPPSSAAPTAAQRIRRFGDWSTVRHEAAGQLTCFALGRGTQAASRAGRGRPSASEADDDGAGVKGGDGHLVYVTSWPQAGIKAEVSVRIALTLGPSAAVQASVGSQTFPLARHGDRAFVGDPTQELRLLEAMKKAGSMVVSPSPGGGIASGPEATEAVSLAGFAAALAHVTQGCP